MDGESPSSLKAKKSFWNVGFSWLATQLDLVPT